MAQPKTATQANEIDFDEKPKQKQVESDEAFKARKKEFTEAKKKHQLKKTAAVRVPRVLATVRSLKSLKANNPTGPQIEAIMKSLDEACAEVETYLKSGKVETFQLPD